MTMTQRYAGMLRRHSFEWDRQGMPVQAECARQAARHMEERERELEAEARLLQTALADLYAQIHEFVATHGEADFYTGAALAVLAKTAPLEYHWPFHSPTAEEAIAKLLAKRGPNARVQPP